MGLRALRQAVEMTPGMGPPSSLQDLPPAPSVVEAPALATTVAATLAPPCPPVVPVWEVTPVVGVDTLATSVSFVAASTSTVTTPLLSDDVATTSAPVMLPPHFLAPSVPPSTMLAVASPSLSSRPHVFLDHLYTSSDVDSLWGAN